MGGLYQRPPLSFLLALHFWALKVVSGACPKEEREERKVEECTKKERSKKHHCKLIAENGENSKNLNEIKKYRKIEKTYENNTKRGVKRKKDLLE